MPETSRRGPKVSILFDKLLFKRCRDAEQLTQEELSDKAKVSIDTVRRAESGVRVSVEKAQKLGKALNVRYQDLCVSDEKLASEPERRLTERFPDPLMSSSNKVSLLRRLGTVVRSEKDYQKRCLLARVIVRGLFDNSKQVRDLSKYILIEIGSAAVEIILDQEIHLIPSKTHGYKMVEDIFISMGPAVAPILGELIDKHIYVVTNVLCNMPPDAVRSTCEQLFFRDHLHGRYREEIGRALQSDSTRKSSDTKALLLKGLIHSDPVVRLISAEWFSRSFPGEARSALQPMLQDNTLVERFYGDTHSRLLSDWIKDLLKS